MNENVYFGLKNYSEEELLELMDKEASNLKEQLERGATIYVQSESKNYPLKFKFIPEKTKKAK